MPGQDPLPAVGWLCMEERSWGPGWCMGWDGVWGCLLGEGALLGREGRDGEGASLNLGKQPFCRRAEGMEVGGPVKVGGPWGRDCCLLGGPLGRMESASRRRRDLCWSAGGELGG